MREDTFRCLAVLAFSNPTSGVVVILAALALAVHTQLWQRPP